MVAIMSSIRAGDRYAWALLFLPLLALFSFGCQLGGWALADDVRYLELKPLPDVEPKPAVLAELLKPPGPMDGPASVAVAASAPPAGPPPEPVFPGLVAGLISLTAGTWIRTTELLSQEVRFVVGVPLVVYGVIRCVLSLLALVKQAYRRR